MKALWLAALLCALAAGGISRNPAAEPPAPAEPAFPISEGTYRFQHRFAEHPDMRSMALEAIITERRIRITNPRATSVFPEGVLAEGELVWHARSGNWIIASAREDVDATDVGGCSDGPEVVDLINRIYWTC